MKGFTVDYIINWDEKYLLDAKAILEIADKYFEHNDFNRWNASSDDILDFATEIEQIYIKHMEGIK